MGYPGTIQPLWMLLLWESQRDRLLDLEIGDAEFPLGSKGPPSRAINQ
jgi:hypothetical protein